VAMLSQHLDLQKLQKKKPMLKLAQDKSLSWRLHRPGMQKRTDLLTMSNAKFKTGRWKS